MKLRMTVAILLWTAIYIAPTARAGCRPDSSSQDKISKQAVVKWHRNLTEIGFWKSMIASDIDVVAVIGRYGDVNALNLQIVNKENDRDRAAFDSRYRAAQGDRFVFGFSDAEPLTFIATEVNNQAKIEEAKGLVMTVILSAHLSDSDLATFRRTLTTKRIDAVRIGLASGMIERSIAEEHGDAMREKFSCFYSYLDDHGIKLPAEGNVTSGGGPAAVSEAREELDLVIQDILAQGKLNLQAMLRRDVTYLDKHIDADAIFESNGKQVTKRMMLAQVAEQQVPPRPVRSRFSAVSSKTTGDVVEVTATTTLSIQTGSGWKDFFEVRGTTKYIKRDGEWIILGGTNEYEKQLK